MSRVSAIALDDKGDIMDFDEMLTALINAYAVSAADTYLSCDCGEARIYAPSGVREEYKGMLEHVLFDHPARHDVIVSIESVALRGDMYKG